MKIDDLNLGQNIKRLRVELNMSQYELSRKSGVTQASISRIEKGKQKNVQLNKLVSICNALDCSLFDLLTDKKVTSLISTLRDYFSK